MAPKSDQLLIHSKTLQDISSNTAQLAADVQSLWQQLETALDAEGGMGILLNHLPACLQADFKDYEQQQKKELDKIVQGRKQIGQLLSEASSLLDFQDQVSRYASIDIYKANTYYDGKNIPEHLLVPDSANPSESWEQRLIPALLRSQTNS